MKIDLSAEELSKILRYDKATGIFTWLVAGNGRVPGARAGTGKTADGHWSLSINGKRYKGHNIAWIMVTGALPAKPIKFRDGDNSNLCFDNLCISTLGVRPPEPKPPHTRRIIHKDNGWHVEVIDGRGTYRSGPWTHKSAAQASADARTRAEREADADPAWLARKIEIAAKISASRYIRPRVGEQPIGPSAVAVRRVPKGKWNTLTDEAWLKNSKNRLEWAAERFDRVKHLYCQRIRSWREGIEATHVAGGFAPGVASWLAAPDDWDGWGGNGAGNDEGPASIVAVEDNLVMDGDAFAAAAGFDGDGELAGIGADDDAAGFGGADDSSPTADPMMDDAEWL